MRKTSRLSWVGRMAALTALVAGSVALSSCAGLRLGPMASVPKTPLTPPHGYIFSKYKAPLDFEKSSKGAGVPVNNTASGMSEAYYVFIPFIGISFGWGDASLDTAARDGNLQTVNYADYETMSVLWVFTNMKVHAHGSSSARAM